jgi:hypothetical protein
MEVFPHIRGFQIQYFTHDICGFLVFHPFVPGGTREGLILGLFVFSNLHPIFFFASFRQLVGKTRWVFRRPDGSNPAVSIQLKNRPCEAIRSKAPAADGRPSGSSLQAGEQEVD